MEMEMVVLPWSGAAAAAAALLLAFLAAIRHLNRGLPRLLCLLPLLPLLAALPFTIHSPFLRSNAAFSFLWLCPTKLLLLCWDISIDDIPPHRLPFLIFLLSLILPLRIKATSVNSQRSSSAAAILSLLLHLVAFIFVFNLSFHRQQRLPAWFLDALCCAEIYIGLEVTFGGLSLLLYLVSGIETHRTFDSPFMAESLSEFWGRRWNLLVTAMLRASVYDPMVRRLRQKCEEKVAMAVATVATFLWSGLVHEAIFVCMTRSKPTGEVTVFFILHGVATVMEKLLRSRSRRNAMAALVVLPRLLCNLLTLAFLYFTVSFLFLAPIRRTATDIYMNHHLYRAQTSIANFLFGSSLIIP